VWKEGQKARSVSVPAVEWFARTVRPSLGCGTLAGWSETVRGSFTFVGGLAAGEVCADTHPVCRPVPWYQIGKNGDGPSPVGGRLSGCLRCGVCCIDAAIGSYGSGRGVSRFVAVLLPSGRCVSCLCVGRVSFQESSDGP
jgi:hypothetical protein